jgi:formylglycine-generating enzyme required for sulfatase activity
LPKGINTDDFPVETVSWDDAIEFCQRLTNREKDQKRTYDLPTEAEWEYACRAGTKTKFSIGNTLSKYDANIGNFDGLDRPTKVGSYKPNAWGLYDMHGNVWEWVQDSWHEDYAGAPTDGALFPGGDPAMRTKRGGGWYSLLSEIRSASRQGDQPDHRGGDIGFRVARGL